MKVATFLLLITPHSHSLTPITDSSIFDAQVSFYHLANPNANDPLLFTAEMSFSEGRIHHRLLQPDIYIVRKNLYHHKLMTGKYH